MSQLKLRSDDICISTEASILSYARPSQERSVSHISYLSTSFKTIEIAILLLQAIAKALDGGAAPQLILLNLRDNPLGPEATELMVVFLLDFFVFRSITPGDK